MGGEEIQEAEHKTKVENRVIAMVTGLSLTFGLWWLQNQYTVTNRLSERLIEFERAMGDKYVHRDVFMALEERVDRVQNQLDAHKSGSRPHGSRSILNEVQ